MDVYRVKIRTAVEQAAIQFSWNPVATTPSERTLHLTQAGAFLRELSVLEEVHGSIRNEAKRLLKHFPTDYEINQIAENEWALQNITQSIFHTPLLTTDVATY